MGALVTRETNMPWLIERFRQDGLILKWRVAGQFIEAYTRVSSPFLAEYMHVGMHHFSFGNILILEKEQ